MWIGVISLFPDMFRALTDQGVTGRALKQGLFSFQCWNPRDFTEDKHRTVDDRPYGGGPGMLMKVQPLRAAIAAAKAAALQAGVVPQVIYLSPQGQRLSQAGATQLASSTGLILVAGRYEGIDERVLQTDIDAEWSIGDYVLSGGELPAMVLLDSVLRLVPGVLGDMASAEQDSFSNGLLDHPHYTRPDEIEGLRVPDVLLQGNHQQIERWRTQQSLGRTWLRRPDILNNLALTDEQEILLAEFVRNERQNVK